MLFGDQVTQMAALQVTPTGDALALAVGENLVQIATIGIQRMAGQLSRAAQVFEVGVEFVLHRAPSLAKRTATPADAGGCAQRTERSGVPKRGKTRASTSAI